MFYIYFYFKNVCNTELRVCAYCPDKALDAHHAVACKFGGEKFDTPTGSVRDNHHCNRTSIYKFVTFNNPIIWSTKLFICVTSHSHITSHLHTQDACQQWLERRV